MLFTNFHDLHNTKGLCIITFLLCSFLLITSFQAFGTILCSLLLPLHHIHFACSLCRTTNCTVLIGNLYPPTRNSTSNDCCLLARLYCLYQRGSPTARNSHHQRSWTPFPPSQSTLDAATLHSMSHWWCQGNHWQVQHVCGCWGPQTTNTRPSDSDPGHNVSAPGNEPLSGIWVILTFFKPMF